jgi:hypothetical protein
MTAKDIIKKLSKVSPDCWMYVRREIIGNNW